MDIKLLFDNFDTVDFSNPVRIGENVFGQEAAERFSQLATQAGAYSAVETFPFDENRFIYWEVFESGLKLGEIIALPTGPLIDAPTAVELALVESLSLLPDGDARALLRGGQMVVLGEHLKSNKFIQLARLVQQPMVGSSILGGRFNSVDLSQETQNLLTETAKKCFESSLHTAPLKFRFLEIYRIIEAKFLLQILNKINSEFYYSPQQSVANALSKLDSEINQITALAEIEKDPFINIRNKIYSKKNNNRFAAALTHKIDNKGKLYRSPEFTAGAALTYYIRCAIVHAGSKDMIFESYPDGDEIIAQIFEDLEEAALLLCGIRIY